MSPVATPASGTHLFYLEGTGVLFCEATQELHLLNDTATLIWSLLEEGHDVAAASSELHQTYGVDADQSRQFVLAALDEWRAKGFLDPSSAGATALSSPVPDHLPGHPCPPWAASEVAEARCYRLLNTCFRIHFSSLVQMQWIHPVLAHLEVEGAPENAIAVDIVENGKTFCVYRDRQAFDGCAGPDELAPIVKSLVWVTAVNDYEFFLDIHAGVVGDGDRCILLPAPPGSGKSTLTAALVYAGYRFFSDEIALLKEGSFDVVPVPLGICVKESGIAALAKRFPDLGALPLHLRADGMRVAYMSPPTASMPATADACPVAALVFPRYASAAATSLAMLPKAEAIKRLLDECLVVRTPLDFPKVEALLRWISRTDCYALTYQSTDNAVAAVQGLFAKLATIEPR